MAHQHNRHLSFSSKAYFPQRQAEKLIRDLNLLPDDDVNVAAHEFKFEPASGRKIVERRLELSVIGNAGPSVQELGHHAGYYLLPHSHAAYYDVRKKCEGDLCYDFSNMERFLNQNSVRESLGVGNIDFVSCSSTVNEAMVMDWMRNLEVGIPALLEDGIKVLVYAGEYDLICNWLRNSRWVYAMEWSGQKNFGSSSTVPFVVDGAEAGLLKGHGPLSFLRVHNAGHMVPMDQPKAALEMLRSWMQGKLATAERGKNSS
ncbi:Serine carboxypeptidase-like [Parasponia andersonii]|uniref:Serine carboxypeptidase-like n=1 Tax=Parasponia andersonii TaxID=3476 RepID=A0A2P5CZS7_PARAD|nr:Serine carboxypeptidase-like [Parasponia andersonii]